MKTLADIDIPVSQVSDTYNSDLDKDSMINNACADSSGNNVVLQALHLC